MSMRVGAGSLVFSPTADERISFPCHRKLSNGCCRGDRRSSGRKDYGERENSVC
jgi:hypothetical protein